MQMKPVVLKGTHPLSIALYLLATGICRMRQSFSRRGARPCCSSGHVHVELLRTHKPFWEYTIKQFSHWMNWCSWWVVLLRWLEYCAHIAEHSMHAQPANASDSAFSLQHV